MQKSEAWRKAFSLLQVRHCRVFGAVELLNAECGKLSEMQKAPNIGGLQHEALFRFISLY